MKHLMVSPPRPTARLPLRSLVLYRDINGSAGHAALRYVTKFVFGVGEKNAGELRDGKTASCPRSPE